MHKWGWGCLLIDNSPRRYPKGPEINPHGSTQEIISDNIRRDNFPDDNPTLMYQFALNSIYCTPISSFTKNISGMPAHRMYQNPLEGESWQIFGKPAGRFLLQTLYTSAAITHSHVIFHFLHHMEKKSSDSYKLHKKERDK